MRLLWHLDPVTGAGDAAALRVALDPRARSAGLALPRLSLRRPRGTNEYAGSVRNDRPT